MFFKVWKILPQVNVDQELFNISATACGRHDGSFIPSIAPHSHVEIVRMCTYSLATKLSKYGVSQPMKNIRFFQTLHISPVQADFFLCKDCKPMEKKKGIKKNSHLNSH